MVVIEKYSYDVGKLLSKVMAMFSSLTGISKQASWYARSLTLLTWSNKSSLSYILHVKNLIHLRSTFTIGTRVEGFHHEASHPVMDSKNNTNWGVHDPTKYGWCHCSRLYHADYQYQNHKQIYFRHPNRGGSWCEHSYKYIKETFGIAQTKKLPPTTSRWLIKVTPQC